MMCSFRNLTRENELKSKGLEVKFVDHGIASRIDNTIEINKALTGSMWADLHDSIMEHELKHDSGKTTMNDFKLDILQSHHDILKFMFYNPKSWTVLIPISRRNKEWVINPTLLIVYGIIGTLILSALAFAFRTF